MKHNRIIIAIIMIGVCAGVYLYFSSNKTTPTARSDKRISIKNFNSISNGAPSCAALTPGCSYCPGEVIENDCYVTQAQFDQYKKLYPDLKSE